MGMVSWSHFECNGVAAFINDSNALLLPSDKFSSIFPYLFKICQWLLSAFFFSFFFSISHLSFQQYVLSVGSNVTAQQKFHLWLRILSEDGLSIKYASGFRALLTSFLSILKTWTAFPRKN